MRFNRTQAEVRAVDLYHSVQQGHLLQELINPRDAILRLRGFFVSILAHRSNRAVPSYAISSQALTMIDALLAPIFPPGPLARPAAPGSLPSLRDLLERVAGQGLRSSTPSATQDPSLASAASVQTGSNAFDTLAYTPVTSRQGSVERFLNSLDDPAAFPLPGPQPSSFVDGSLLGDQPAPFENMASTAALVNFMSGSTLLHSDDRLTFRLF
jgi:hypothetical protein